MSDAPADGRARRADARRNATAILDAGLAVLTDDPDAGLARVARAAGTTRTTLYSHYPSREHLLDALVRRVVQQAAEDIDAAGDPGDTGAVGALRTMLRTSWEALGRHRSLVEAAGAVLGPERMSALHEPVRTRLLALLEHGRATGAVRTDVPAEWLLATYLALVHLAAEQVRTGGIGADEAFPVLWATLTGAFGIDDRSA